MGVRFECPAGHKLNVKTELAGQRGICPECGARFIVPCESGGRATPPPSKGGAKGGTSSTANHRSPNGLTTVAIAPPEGIASPSTPPTFGPPESTADESEWYLRTAAGQQFGPASTATISGWLAEGRIPDDGWLWQTGWAAWRPARDARSHLTPRAAGLSTTAAVTAPPAAAFGSDEFDAAVDWPTVDSSPAADPTLSVDLPQATIPLRTRRRTTSGALLVLLGVVALAVLTAMIFVLNRDPTAAASGEADPSQDLPASDASEP